jgi:hypothetical protein
MKKYLIPLAIIGLALLLQADTRQKEYTPVTADDIVDEDFLKREIQNEVLSFVEEMGLDPDTCYIPFQ